MKTVFKQVVKMPVKAFLKDLKTLKGFTLVLRDQKFAEGACQKNTPAGVHTRRQPGVLPRVELLKIGGLQNLPACPLVNRARHKPTMACRNAKPVGH